MLSMCLRFYICILCNSLFYSEKNVIFIHVWLFCFWTVLDTYIKAGKTHSKQYPFLSENGVVTVRVSRRKKGRINYLGTIHMCSRYIPT